MNWEAIGAVGEIIGALAVVASLGYLAVQIGHNTRQLEQQNRSHEIDTLSLIANNFNNFRYFVIGNADVSLLWDKGREDLYSLEKQERSRFDLLANQFFWGFGMLYLLQGIGGIDRASLELTMKNLRIWALEPGLKQWWNESRFRNDYPEEFIALVSNMYASN